MMPLEIQATESYLVCVSIFFSVTNDPRGNMESSGISNAYFNCCLWLSVSSQMRETLVKAVTGQTIASQQSAKLVSSSLNQVTQVQDEISLAAQVRFGACRTCHTCTCMPRMLHLHTTPAARAATKIILNLLFFYLCKWF